MSATPHDRLPAAAAATRAFGKAVISNRAGLHVRPMGAFTELAITYASTIRVAVGERGPVDGKSAIGLIGLAARHGETLELQADGPDAEAAIRALIALVENHFGLPRDD